MTEIEIRTKTIKCPCFLRLFFLWDRALVRFPNSPEKLGLPFPFQSFSSAYPRLKIIADRIHARLTSQALTVGPLKGGSG